MAKLGTERTPLIFRVQTEERLKEVAGICQSHGWIFIGGLEEDKPEDISDVEYMLNLGAFTEIPKMRRPTNKPIVKKEPEIGRNDPCPCGSGKKYKKCCGS